MDTMKGQAERQSEVFDFLTTPAWPDANRFRDLARVTLAAGRFMPPFYLRSIFGKFRSWAPPHERFSEYNIIDPWKLARTLRFLMDVTVPASPTTTPDWARSLFPPIVNRRLWRPTRFFRNPDEYGGVSSFPDEHWFFINGILTNEDVARVNADYLAHLFHRPVTVVQNATDSLPLDVYECALGKGFKDDPNSEDRKTMTEPAWRATAAILEALNAPQTKRVVVIAHSQGTIIVANVLRAVANLLKLSLHRGDAEPLIQIDGPMFVQRGAWGHLLNEHYLSRIDDFLYPRTGRHHRDEDPYPRVGKERSRSRLYDYFHGKRPEDKAARALGRPSA